MVNPKTTEFIRNMNYKIMILANRIDDKETALAYAKQLCRENVEWLRREEAKEKEAYLEQHNDSSYADKQADYS